MQKDSIDFIAQRYRKGCFSPDSGWQRLGITPVSTWKRYRVAAAVAASVVLTATAAFFYNEYSTVENTELQPNPVLTKPAVSPLAEVKVIDFENASLTEVVKKIEAIYNVKVQNIPADADEYELSLHYEGTPTDLISTINEILGTHMSVKEKHN